MRIRSAFAAVVVSALGLHFSAAAEVNVYAAASLTDVLKELGATYEKQGQDKVAFNFAASSLLARQITEDAPADIFFSADEAKMDELAKAGRIDTGSRRDLLSNSLVIVVPGDSTIAISSPDDLLAKTKKIAIADPRAVPAGIYAKKYLSGVGLWQSLESRLVPTENVRAALAAVDSGNVDAGFVYRTDANISKKVKIAYRVVGDKAPPIRYPIALIRDSKNNQAAELFLHYLESDEALKVFERYGFIVKF